MNISDHDHVLDTPITVGDRCVTLANRNPTDPHTARVDQWYGASA